MSTWTQMSRALQRLWSRLAAPQELYYINGPDTLPPPLTVPVLEQFVTVPLELYPTTPPT